MSSQRRLRVKFILPSLTEATSPFWRPIKYSLFPPLGLATLAAYLAPGDDAVIVDEHVEPLRTDDTPDLVVIQVYITNAYRAYRIADTYRARGVFVVLGGLHVTALPREAAPHADAIFLGPGEQTFPRFLDDFRAGHPLRVYQSTGGRTLDRVPPVRRDLIARSRYLVPTPSSSHADVRSIATSATRTPSSAAADRFTRSAWTMRLRRSRGCQDGICTSSTTTCWVIRDSQRICSAA